MFWNVENLFDMVDDSITADEEFLSESYLGWNERVYQYKVEQISRIINDEKPQIVGLAEVENREVLEALCNKMDNSEVWGIIHQDGDDPRGIDCALLYRTDFFTVIHERYYRPHLVSGGKTRDFLLVELAIKNVTADPFVVGVLHFPSKRGGESRSEPDRLACSRQLVTLLHDQYKGKKILLMGDLNAGSNDEPVKILRNFFSPLITDVWTYVYRAQKEQLDHLFASSEFFIGTPSICKESAKVLYHPAMQNEFGFPEAFIQQRQVVGGFSDHYPLSVTLVYQKNFLPH
ncbi:MAG: endonuclease/exonuclease/phosphatase family protein [Candidatus Marinimicrobia bacterium]|nr:endonuclease/exonuclease/phosphatase family protein [Candidatus Neomarinimicrobiota bacterium]MDD5582190.1 endonuclease/exonuclease/phosphatase family protein [Candidatus Neomarinimicrobiota bacterium]